MACDAISVRTVRHIEDGDVRIVKYLRPASVIKRDSYKYGFVVYRIGRGENYVVA